MPLMRQLGLPTLFCHKLEADADGMLVNYHLRMPNQKKEVGASASRNSTSRSSPPAIPTTTRRCSAKPTPASCSTRRRTSSASSRSSRSTNNYDELRAAIDKARAEGRSEPCIATASTRSPPPARTGSASSPASPASSPSTRAGFSNRASTPTTLTQPLFHAHRGQGRFAALHARRVPRPLPARSPKNCRWTGRSPTAR